mmetsp:Transcript_138083/g.253994  ORF Transcript_138083/g.253994 Transcript_138083/m.253994 type:complete len:405 (+) Transcript_138083:142-1356(+)
MEPSSVAALSCTVPAIDAKEALCLLSMAFRASMTSSRGTAGCTSMAATASSTGRSAPSRSGGGFASTCLRRHRAASKSRLAAHCFESTRSSASVTRPKSLAKLIRLMACNTGCKSTELAFTSFRMASCLLRLSCRTSSRFIFLTASRTGVKSTLGFEISSAVLLNCAESSLVTACWDPATCSSSLVRSILPMASSEAVAICFNVDSSWRIGERYVAVSVNTVAVPVSTHSDTFESSCTKTPFICSLCWSCLASKLTSLVSNPTNLDSNSVLCCLLRSVNSVNGGTTACSTDASMSFTAASTLSRSTWGWTSISLIACSTGSRSTAVVMSSFRMASNTGFRSTRLSLTIWEFLANSFATFPAEVLQTLTTSLLEWTCSFLRSSSACITDRKKGERSNSSLMFFIV